MTILIKFAAFVAALIAAFWLGGVVLKKDNKGCGDYYEKWTPPGQDVFSDYYDELEEMEDLEDD